MIRRVFISKKQGFDTVGKNLLRDLQNNLNITSLEDIELINRYDIKIKNENNFNLLVDNVLSEVNTDKVYYDKLPDNKGAFCFGIEYLPGQYDQRADSAVQCANLIMNDKSIRIKNARIYIIHGDLAEDEINKIKNYLINPVDSREASLDDEINMDEEEIEVKETPVIHGFTEFSEAELETMLDDMGLAMDSSDLKMIQDYFRDDEKRNPTLTEIRVLDTYWSDHCRHTTFGTYLEDIKFAEGSLNKEIENIYKDYLEMKKSLYKENKPTTLMNLATIGTKSVKARGLLPDLEESDEINACSIRADIKVDDKDEKYLIMFKNETHNHPTEIEPFGGAATCLGGAIRDPLSGRAYVYQSMRVTGSGDPTASFDKTLKGKLPQRKITTEACHGFSSYGNQIGLQTGQVKEYYNEGYKAKRMEIGAVIAAAKEENVKRLKPEEGDIIILVGGRTGRDGIGGASGSSKEHTEKSVETAGSEVQKGNPVEERKLQRLFRNEKVSKMIKKCNDFGAGGVSVAVGELADSLSINLDSVLKKYEGLDATEIAISESQERMAVVVDTKDKDKFIKAAKKENLEAVVVADVTDDGRMIMTYEGKEVVNLKRSFIDTNGAHKTAKVSVDNRASNALSIDTKNAKTNKEKFAGILTSHNACYNRGLVDHFDNTIGATNILAPYGGKYFLTEEEGMVSKIPLVKGDTEDTTIMTHGFDPELADKDPYISAVYAVISSLAKAVSLGADYKRIRLSLQEYFERLRDDSSRWAKPFTALLGALRVQLEMDTPAIGGKDSMSGSFENMDVPPTLVSFAVAVSKADYTLGSAFKEAGSNIYVFKIDRNENDTPDYDSVRDNFNYIHELIKDGKVKASRAVSFGGAAEALSKMAFGNKIGVNTENTDYDIYAKNYGDIIIETSESIDYKNAVLLGKTTEDKTILIDDEKIELEDLINEYKKPLDSVFPAFSANKVEAAQVGYLSGAGKYMKAGDKVARPKVIIPAFPGNNCEYDTAKAFNEAGADAEIFIFKNKTEDDIKTSVKELTTLINGSNILAFPGGFSAGDEPDGSAKFIVSVLKNKYIKEAVMNLIDNKDGLIIGICNGFQALIKTGLLPFGEIKTLSDNDPTLTFNSIGRHIANLSYMRVASTVSPWLSSAEVGDVYLNPLSHGEGRFVCDDETLAGLIKNGQIASQYSDAEGNINDSTEINLNGSVMSIEGITSKDGRIFGKMGHVERTGKNLYKNAYGRQDNKIFENGVKYFK